MVTINKSVVFLFQEAELCLVKHLPNILTLQRDLVKKFQNITELNFRTIADFLNSPRAGNGTTFYIKIVMLLLNSVFFEGWCS